MKNRTKFADEWSIYGFKFFDFSVEMIHLQRYDSDYFDL